MQHRSRLFRRQRRRQRRRSVPPARIVGSLPSTTTLSYLHRGRDRGRFTLRPLQQYPPWRRRGRQTPDWPLMVTVRPLLGMPPRNGLEDPTYEYPRLRAVLSLRSPVLLIPGVLRCVSRAVWKMSRPKDVPRRPFGTWSTCAWTGSSDPLWTMSRTAVDSASLSKRPCESRC